ncbi:MAG: hypothetical protein H6726_26790 [Sandaracinaceae bacterium]|nr:hypothetical protein [Sandaracinaceae bacterium]
MPTPTNYMGVGWDLVIASSTGTATGTYRFGNGTPVAFTATAAAPAIVALSTANGVAASYHTVETRGIFIESDIDIFVAARTIAGPWQSSASIKEASYALGTRFRAGGYNLNADNTPNTGHDTLSFYAPTGASVTVTAPPGAMGNFWQGVTGLTHTFTLAAGETFVMRSVADTCNNEIDGALITATAPIAVLSGGRGWSGTCSVTGSCGDDGLDNILPTTQWGSVFTVTNYPGGDTQGEDVRVVADTDNTEVMVNGSLVATLDAGERHRFVPAAGATLIETSNPVAVYQNAAQTGCEIGLSFLPPTEFRGSTSLNVAVDVDGNGTAVVTIETNRVSSLRLDGAVLSSPTLNVVPGRPDVTMVRFAIADGVHIVSSSGDFQMGLVTGRSGTGLFAFYNPFRVPGCGNGQIDAGEGCDDGGVMSGDGCSANCRIEIGTMGCLSDAQCVAGGHCDAMGVCRACITDAHCNDGNACSTDTCVANVCVNTSLMAGVTCPGGVCDGAAMNPSCVTCIDTAAGMGQDLGCTAGAPQCTSDGMGGFACVGCLLPTDCLDGNPCTTDLCVLGTCSNPPVLAGLPCAGGVCNGSVGAPECVVCIDSTPGTGLDAGCTLGTPMCDRSGSPAVCVECITSTNCGSSGDICVGGTCDAPSITLSAPTGTITALSTTPSGGATHLPNGTMLSVTVTSTTSSDMFTCTGFVMGTTWTCAAGSISGLTAGTTYDVSVTGTVDGVMVSATGSFSVGGCAGATAGDACTSGASPGTCQGSGTLSCCTGCWDGSTCRTGNTVLACGTAGGACAACADANECTDDVCGAGACTNPPTTEGTTCSTGVCDGLGSALCEVCVDDGSGVDSGCSAGAPDCIGASGSRECVACTADAQCDDGNVCTTDACVGNTCMATPVAAGDAGMCMGGEVCSGAPSNMCVTCADTDPTGTDAGCTGGAPFCVVGMSGATCELCVDDGAGTDTGCDAATPNCVVGSGGANECVSCAANSECSDGNECTDDVCSAGMCSNPTVTEFTTCSAGVCTAAAMCAAVQVTITSPADQSVSNNNTPTLTGTGTPGATIELSLDMGGPLTTTVDASGNWSLTLSSPLEDGGHGLLAIINVALLSDTDMVNFAIDTMTDVAITAPADGSTSLDATPTITGTGEPGATVVVSIDGTEVGTTTVDGNGAWTVTPSTPLTNGQHDVEVVATDVAGNSASDAVTFTVDSNTDVAITQPANGSVTSDNTPTVSGTAVPGASVEVTIVVDGSDVSLGTVIADASGNWSVDVTSALLDGTYTVTATATDTAANMAQDSASFTVDTATTVSIDTADSVTGVITGTGEPGATVVVSIDGTVVGTATVDGSGSWTLTVGPLSAGDHTITADATDVAGNTADDMLQLTVSVMDGGVPDGGFAPDGGVSTTGGVSGGALCATHTPTGEGWPALLGLLAVGLVVSARRRRR